MKGADFVKFLLSLLVVWVHTGVGSLGAFNSFIIPSFFFFSGFFLFGKVFNSDTQTEIVTTWWKNTFRLYITWTLIFLPFAVYGFFLDDLPLWKGALVWLRNVVFRGENYLSWPLWYMLGLLQSGAIIWLFAKMKWPFWMLCIIAAGLWALPKYVNLNSIKIWSSVMRTTGDGYTVGLPFMVLGGLFRQLFPSIKGWPIESSYYRPAITLRFFSIHVYLTHMLWAGLLMILTSIPRGFILWVTVTSISLTTGLIVHMFPSIKKVLYGRSYSVSWDKTS